MSSLSPLLVHGETHRLPVNSKSFELTRVIVRDPASWYTSFYTAEMIRENMRAHSALNAIIGNCEYEDGVFRLLDPSQGLVDSFYSKLSSWSNDPHMDGFKEPHDKWLKGESFYSFMLKNYTKGATSVIDMVDMRHGVISALTDSGEITEGILEALLESSPVNETPEEIKIFNSSEHLKDSILSVESKWFDLNQGVAKWKQ